MSDYIKDGKDFIRSCNITDKYCIINCYCEKVSLTL